MVWISQGVAHFPLVNFRYIVYPKGPLDNSWVPINFDPSTMKALIEKGRNDAKEVVKKGPGVNFKELSNSLMGSFANPFNIDYNSFNTPTSDDIVEKIVKESN